MKSQADGWVTNPIRIPVTVEMGLDFGWWPWLAPDRNPMPRMDLFPRASAMVRRVRFVRWRVALAWSVLLHGVECPEGEGWDW